MEGIKSDRVSSSRSRSGDRNGGGSQLGKMREKKRSPSSSSGRSSPGRNSQAGSVGKRRRVRREGRKSRSSSRERFIRNREKSKSWLQHPGKRRNERFGRRRTSPLYSRYGPRFNYLRNRSPRRQVGRFGPNRWGDRGERNNDFHYRRDNNRRPNRYSPRSSPERTPERRRSDGERPTTTVSADEKSADEGTKQEPKTPNSDYEEKSEKGSKSGSNIDDVLNLLDSTSADLKLLRKSSPSSSDESSSNSSSSEAKKRKHKSKSRKKPKKEKKKKHKKSDRSRSVSKSKSKKKSGEDAKSKAKCTSREAEELLKLLSGPIEITAPQSVSSSKQERFHNDGPSTSGDYKHHRSDSRSDERRHSNDNRKRDSGQRNDSDSRKRQRQS